MPEKKRNGSLSNGSNGDGELHVEHVDLSTLSPPRNVGLDGDSVNGIASEISFYRSLNASAEIGIAKFRRQIEEIVNRLGFSHYSFSRLGSVGDYDAQLMTVPKKIAENYHAERFYEHDLILEHCSCSTVPIRQTVVENYLAGAPVISEKLQRNLELYRMTARFGYYDFFNIPHKASNNDGNVVLSITSEGEDANILRQKFNNRLAPLKLLVEAIEYVGTLKFPNWSADEDKKTALTPRPLRLLTVLAKEDLTLNEAADNLCISIHTANQHIAATRKAFGVRTTSGAVYQAIKQRLIRF